MTTDLPRLVVAGPSGDAGKTLVCLALAAAWRRGGARVVCFKKGPDFIDRAWLAWASGREARNLDAYLMPIDALLGSFREGAAGTDLALVEGNRGLHDGLDARGTYSTAELAKSLHAPVVLLLDAAKVTRTAAAVALGMQRLDPDCRIGAVILNRVGGARHEAILREAVTGITGLPVLGAIPRQPELATLLPDRHLGLVTPEEHPDPEALRARLVSLGEAHLDLAGLRAMAESAPLLPLSSPGDADEIGLSPTAIVAPGEPPVEIGYFSDKAFTFYYPENFSALQAAGARLVPISAMADQGLPAVHALYLGGGFPETQAAALRENRSLRQAVARAARARMPIYAECGGLMYLCRSFLFRGERYEMAGVFPVDLAIEERPQGHGYLEARVDGENPFFPRGTLLRGHEFHYSRVIAKDGPLETAYAVTRGVGAGGGRDGLRAFSTLGSYLHLHSLGAPGWAPGLVAAARGFRGSPPVFPD